jgi:hypothetical protein
MKGIQVGSKYKKDTKRNPTGREVGKQKLKAEERIYLLVYSLV